MTGSAGNKAERRPYVAIYGDDEGQQATKLLWSALSGQDLKMVSAKSREELIEIAPDAVLILIRTNGAGDANNELAYYFLHDQRVVADIIAITEAPVEERIKIMAAGFDSIFNLDFFELPELKNILLNRIDKGFVSLENRIQQEEYRRFKAALAASPDAFIVFDERNRLFFVSEHYRKAYPKTGRKLVRGIKVMDAFRMCIEEIGFTEQNQQYKDMSAFWERLDGEAEFSMDDGRIWHLKAKKLPDGQGTIITTADITRYRQQQLEVEQSAEKLGKALAKEKEAGAIQKQFISMVSHEFRTPLSIIDGNAQILYSRARTLDEEAIKKRSKTIRSAVSRLVNMMEGVLSSNMLHTGNLELRPEPVNLKELINELCEEYTDLASTHKFDLDIGRLPDEVILDRKLITLVLGNFLSNAIKFTRERPQISVKGWAEHQNIVIKLEDNGIGIPPNELSRIFDRYYRTTSASGIPGTGIGLSLAKDLVQLHKGTIEVESEVGAGTSFTIRLPIK